MCLLPQFLDIWSNSREAVDAVHHTMLLNELGAALEDLGHCEEKKNMSPHNISFNIFPVFTGCYKVKNRMTFLFDVWVHSVNKWLYSAFGQETLFQLRVETLEPCEVETEFIKFFCFVPFVGLQPIFYMKRTVS